MPKTKKAASRSVHANRTLPSTRADSCDADANGK